MPALAAMEAAGKLPAGALAVLYDKNKMEAGGYAAALADLTGEQVQETCIAVRGACRGKPGLLDHLLYKHMGISTSRPA